MENYEIVLWLSLFAVSGLVLGFSLFSTFINTKKTEEKPDHLPSDLKS